MMNEENALFTDRRYSFKFENLAMDFFLYCNSNKSRLIVVD